MLLGQACKIQEADAGRLGALCAGDSLGCGIRAVFLRCGILSLACSQTILVRSAGDRALYPAVASVLCRQDGDRGEICQSGRSSFSGTVSEPYLFAEIAAGMLSGLYELEYILVVLVLGFALAVVYHMLSVRVGKFFRRLKEKKSSSL